MVRICTEDLDKNTSYEEHFKSMTNGQFELSPFQKHSIAETIKGNHVLITAHTGSGKTLPAEFMFKWFTGQGKKVIYASPIKALSNQKLYDMRKKYPDISFGLLTGDVKDNPDADVLIMTTEILRNTLFNMQVQEQTQKEMPLSFSMNINNELGGVVFDEVHYINDPDRGSVWEQSILLLPPHVQLLMLSATINKPERFAKWIEDQKQSQARANSTPEKEVIVAPTYERVVPLTHYCWLQSNSHIEKKARKTDIEPLIKSMSNKPIVIKSPTGDFVNDTARDICKIKGWMWDNRCYVKRPHVMNEVAKYLKENNMLPAINFIFSRRHVELAAGEIQHSLFNEEEATYSSTVGKACRKILASKLTNYHEYLELPEYKTLVSMLEKGIAYHHGGMMQVLKEMVELLFDQGYIKMLFATETFAVGINMPTKTVVFHSLEKWDGNGKRLLAPHEYTQMAGRAGRRGLDTVGHVIHCNNLFDAPSMIDYKNMLCGAPQQLSSKFKISYGLVLNVVASGAKNLDKIYQFVSQSMIKTDIDKEIDYYDSEVEKMKTRVERMRQDVALAKTPMEDLIKYMDLCNSISMLNQKKRKKAQRDISNLEQEYKSLGRDAELMRNILQIEENIAKNSQYKDNANEYLINEVKNVSSILVDEGYLTLEDDVYTITELGLVASQLQEVHSAAFARVIVNTNYLKEFTPADIASLISAFTNIRVPEEHAALYPNSGNSTIDSALKQLQGEVLRFHQKELDLKICTGENEDIQFNLCSSILAWCKCEDEDSCKTTLRQICNEQSGIFLGDFIKAILKINNVASELEKVAEVTNNTELLEKLQHIPDNTLKYVANKQSLYI